MRRIFPLVCLLLALSHPPARAELITNGDFESSPALDGWVQEEVITAPGLNGPTTAARLSYQTLARLFQSVPEQTDFTFEVDLMTLGNKEEQSLRAFLTDADENPVIGWRAGRQNRLQIGHGTGFIELLDAGTGAPFVIPPDQPVRFQVIGRDLGSPQARYDLRWSDPGDTALVHVARDLSFFIDEAAAQTAGIAGVLFDRHIPDDHSYVVDNVSLVAGAADGVPATHAPVPVTRRISGVYPHLAMSTGGGESGIGALAVQAGDLWAVAYRPHSPGGSGDRNFVQITPSRAVNFRPEAVGGTPANRMFHAESGRLFIGHHVIDPDGTVHTIPVSNMRGRLTGAARHLTDPANKLYVATMEEGLYEVDVHTLEVTPLYRDLNGSNSGVPEANLPGAHGKGLYTSNGLLYYTNNGGSGALASWDGDDWTAEKILLSTEVTGPGGISGNAPGDDRLWSVGWDDRSVVLHLREGGAQSPWHTFRLPKSSYTHDASSGYYTEWPRIRQLDPADPDSPYLMHMHGLFYEFPGGFSSTDFSGLTPLASYYKMPVDYTLFNGELVIAKNDASEISNSSMSISQSNMVGRPQSNFWWGQLDDLQDWGAPHGHGGVWLGDSVAAGEFSDPFLVHGFGQITLHLRHGGSGTVDVEVHTGSGDGQWTLDRTLTIPASGYTNAVLDIGNAEWIRLRALQGSSNLSAFFHLNNPYPHVTPASRGTRLFDGLADIRDTANLSDGVLRLMSSTDLILEFASARLDAEGDPQLHGYHQIGAGLVLNNLDEPALESDLRQDAGLSLEWSFDPASAYVEDGGTRYRLPKLDPAYEAPFASGWARGFREVVTERALLNCHGTFYEVPRGESLRKIKPIATHGKQITDFASWRGMLVLTGVLDSAPASTHIVRTADGNAALWLGEVDDLWQLGELRGVGGPWFDTPVSAGSPSDPYLMYGYQDKRLDLSHDHSSPVTFTLEVDFAADGVYSPLVQLDVPPGETLTHVLPQGFHAHWARLVSDTSTTATAQFTYGPAHRRDLFLDWARDHGLPTGGGRAHVARLDPDDDGVPALAEYAFDGGPHSPTAPPFQLTDNGSALHLRDQLAGQGFTPQFEFSDDLDIWTLDPARLQPAPDQSGVPDGFTRYHMPFDFNKDLEFHRLRLQITP